MTRVVHLKREPYDVLICRPTEWGNPFEIGKDGTRAEVIKKYETWLRNNPALLSKILELDGKVLGCWCHPKPCHGDVIVKLINEIKRENKFFEY